jgi:hypothetical protein
MALDRSPRGLAPRTRRQSLLLTLGAIAASGALVALLLGPAPATRSSRGAGAAPAPMARSSTWSVAEGGNLTVQGSGFAPRTAVRISLAGPGAGHAQTRPANGAGAVTAVVAVPRRCPQGWRVIELSGQGADHEPMVQEVGVEVTKG